MPEEEWEMVPHKILSDLKDEVQALKEKMGKPEAPAQELLDGMSNLNSSIKQLQDLFNTALASINAEEPVKDNKSEFQAIHNHLSGIEKQNEQNARAVVALANILEDKKSEPAIQMVTSPPPFMQQPRPMPRQMNPQPRAPFPAPSMSMERDDFIPQSPPFPSRGAPMPGGGMPPPPSLSMSEKRGLFNKLFGK